MDEKLKQMFFSVLDRWEEFCACERCEEVGKIEATKPCAFCEGFNTFDRYEKNLTCVGCPIFEKTGREYCDGTPYEQWAGTEDSLYDENPGPAQLAAEKELEFLNCLFEECLERQWVGKRPN